jgi:hypothetical protein
MVGVAVTAADADMARLEHQRHWSALRLHPVREMLKRIVGFLGAVGDVHQIGIHDISA